MRQELLDLPPERQVFALLSALVPLSVLGAKVRDFDPLLRDVPLRSLADRLRLEFCESPGLVFPFVASVVVIGAWSPGCFRCFGGLGGFWC